jgi:hypothetical protein
VVFEESVLDDGGDASRVPVHNGSCQRSVCVGHPQLYAGRGPAYFLVAPSRASLDGQPRAAVPTLLES